MAEIEDGFERLPPADEIPGALTRCIMIATEAKTAALQELAVNSR